MSLTATPSSGHHRARKVAVVFVVLLIPMVAGAYYYGYNTGTLTLLITDDAIAEFRSLNITFAEVAIHSTNALATTPWVTVKLDTTTVDLTTLSHNVTETLGLGKIPAAKYTQLRIIVESAVGTLVTGEQVAVTVPGGELRTETPFEMEPMGELTILVRLLVNHVGSTYQLQPALGSIEAT